MKFGLETKEDIPFYSNHLMTQLIAAATGHGIQDITRLKLK